MFLAHLWATEYVAPPELGFTGSAWFYKYVAATRLGAFAGFRGRAAPTLTETLPASQLESTSHSEWGFSAGHACQKKNRQNS